MLTSAGSAIALLMWIAAAGPDGPAAHMPTATPSAAEVGGSSRQAPRSFVKDETVSPDYWHVAAEVARVWGPALDPETPYRLGDYTRLSLDGRLSLGERFELAAGVSLPPKRSEVTEVPTIVGGFLLARLALGPRSSLFTQAFAERLLPLRAPRDDGAWGAASLGLDAREYVDRE